MAHAIAGVSLAWAVERRADLLAAAKKWTLAAVDYEPWGYTYSKPNMDLAAGHLLYAIGWAYDLLYHELTPEERGRIRASLERHAALVHAHFTPSPKRTRFEFTQNHNFIPTAGLGVAALALLGESPEAERWAAAAYAHHHRANQLLSPDGYYFEGIEYWIFSAPWLVHFADAWEHATGESLWELGPYRHWKLYVAHVLLPNGQDAFDFGDAWEGPLTRERRGEEIARLYPGGTLQSNANLLYRRRRAPARPRDAGGGRPLPRVRPHEPRGALDAAVAGRKPRGRAYRRSLPLRHRFQDSGVVFFRTSWEKDALAFALQGRARPRATARRGCSRAVPEWRQSTGHSHPDAGSFIVWAGGTHVVSDTGYAGRPQARHHNTVVVGGFGQGLEQRARHVGGHGPRGARQRPHRGGHAQLLLGARRRRDRGGLSPGGRAPDVPPRVLLRGAGALPGARPARDGRGPVVRVVPPRGPRVHDLRRGVLAATRAALALARPSRHCRRARACARGPRSSRRPASPARSSRAARTSAGSSS